MSLKAIGRQLITILLTALIGGLLGATLVRFAPGFGIQESDLNAQLSSQARQALHQQDAGERNVVSYYAHYLGQLAHGDLGYSRSGHSIFASGWCRRWMVAWLSARAAGNMEAFSVVQHYGFADYWNFSVYPLGGSSASISRGGLTGKTGYRLDCVPESISLRS